MEASLRPAHPGAMSPREPAPVPARAPHCQATTADRRRFPHYVTGKARAPLEQNLMESVSSKKY